MNDKHTLRDLFTAEPGEIPLVKAPRVWAPTPTDPPYNHGHRLLRRCMSLGTAQAVGLGSSDAHGLIGIETENGFFSIRLPPSIVALLAAELQNVRERTSD